MREYNALRRPDQDRPFYRNPINGKKCCNCHTTILDDRHTPTTTRGPMCNPCIEFAPDRGETIEYA